MSGVYASAGAAHGPACTASSATPDQGRWRHNPSMRDVPTGHTARGTDEARAFVSGALKMAPVVLTRCSACWSTASYSRSSG